MIYAAVHIISESTDHYNLLLEINDINDFEEIKNKILNQVSESPEHWSQLYVNTNNEEADTLIYAVFNVLLLGNY